MEYSDIFPLIDRFERGTLQHMELEAKGIRLVLDKGTAQAATPVPTAPAPLSIDPSQPEGRVIRAPLVGTFYAAPAPDAPALASVGQAVKKGQTVCILEAMKMMSEVPAPADGVIAEVLVADGALVGFDQPLFRLK